MTAHRRPPAAAVRPAPLAALLLAAASAAAVGCDAASPGGGACAEIGVPDVGLVSATTPDGEFRTACATVSARDGLFLVIAREPGSGALGGATLELTVDGTEPGTYALGEGGLSSAAYGPGPAATVGARSGSITVASFEGGARGTFAFVTVTGAEVTGGRFDLDL